jgi:hypothetical protein
VKANRASTLLPYLAAIELSQTESKNVCQFADPVPYRTVTDWWCTVMIKIAFCEI